MLLDLESDNGRRLVSQEVDKLVGVHSGSESLLLCEKGCGNFGDSKGCNSTRDGRSKGHKSRRSNGPSCKKRSKRGERHREGKGRRAVEGEGEEGNEAVVLVGSLLLRWWCYVWSCRCHCSVAGSGRQAVSRGGLWLEL